MLHSHILFGQDFPPLGANAKSSNQLPPSPQSLNATQAFHFDRYVCFYSDFENSITIK